MWGDLRWREEGRESGDRRYWAVPFHREGGGAVGSARVWAERSLGGEMNGEEREAAAEA